MPTVPNSQEYSDEPDGLFGRKSSLGRAMPSDGGPGENVRFGASAAPSAGPDADTALSQARYNEAAVASAQGQFLDASNAVLHSSPGAFMSLTGADALHGAAAAQKALADAHQQLADNLHNDTQREMFGRVTAPTIAAAVEIMRQHTSRQLDQFEADASQARATAARDAAVSAYNPAPGADNAYYRQCLLMQKLELEKQADRHGMTETDPAHPDYAVFSARRNQYIQMGGDGRSGIASTYSNIITRLLNGDQVQPAQDYFDQVRDALPEGMRDKLDGYIAAGREKHEGLGAALRVKSQTADSARQQELLDGMLNDGAISPAAHDLARQKISADAARIANEQAANDSHIIGRVRDLKNANPNAALTDLPAGDYAYLKSRGLDQHANAILDGHPATDDPGLFNQLHRQSVEDPVAFDKLNLATVSGQMNKAHFDTLSSAQNAINRQNPQDIEGLRLINRTVDGLTADMQAAGLNTNPEPGSAGAEKHAGFEAGLRDTLIAAQQAKKGTPLSSDEARGIALGFLKDQALSGSGYFARAGGEETQSGGEQGSETTEDGSEAGEVDAAPDSDKHEPEQAGGQPQPDQSAEGSSQEDRNGGDDGAAHQDEQRGQEQVGTPQGTHLESGKNEGQPVEDVVTPNTPGAEGGGHFMRASLSQQVRGEKPNYSRIESEYKNINDKWRPHWYSWKDSQRVVDEIGGQLKSEHDKGNLGSKPGQVDTCAIRLSYALNNGGQPIDASVAKRAGVRTYKGGDGKLYIVSARELVPYLKEQYGSPTDVGQNADGNGKGEDKRDGVPGLQQRISGQHGIFVYLGNLGGASGHGTLWNGSKVVQQWDDYSTRPGIKGYFWRLPDKATGPSQKAEGI